MTVADLNSETLELLRAAAKSTDKTDVTALDVATSHNLSTRAIVNELRLIREAMHLASPFASGTGASSPPESLTAQALTSLQAGDLKQAAEADRESMKMICLELAEAYQRIFAQGGLTLAGLQDTTITTPADLELVQYDNALSKWVNRTAAASGLVVGPGSATDNAVCRFHLTTGKIIQNGPVIIDDSGNVSGVGAFTAGGVATFNGTLAGTAVLDEDDMASDSEVKIATQQSIKAYVDTEISVHTHVEADITDLQPYMLNLVDDTTPELGGDLALAATGVGTRSFIFDHATTALLQIINSGDGAANLLVGGSIQVNVDLFVLGDITVSGTVDGRDVDADGTKLDAIEAAADVTVAANVNAAGAIMVTDATAKGDLIIGMAAGAFGLVGVGSNDQVLTAASGEASGVKWAAAGGGGDLIDDTSPQLGANLDCNTFDIQFDDATGIRDDSDNEQLIFQKTASAVTYFEMTNAATGNGPTLAVTGETNVDFNLLAKGTGIFTIGVAGNVGLFAAVAYIFGPNQNKKAHLGSASKKWDTAHFGGKVDANEGGVRGAYYAAALSNPPTDAQLDSGVGAPASLGSGFKVMVKDTTSGNYWFMGTDGTGWYRTAALTVLS